MSIAESKTEAPSALFPREEYKQAIFDVARGKRELPIPGRILDAAGMLDLDVDAHLKVARERVQAADGLRRVGELQVELQRAKRESVGQTPLAEIKTVADLVGAINHFHAESNPHTPTPRSVKIADLMREIGSLRAGSSKLWASADPAIERGIQVCQGDIDRLGRAIAKRREEFDMDGEAETKLRKDLATAERGGQPDGFSGVDPRRAVRELRHRLHALLEMKGDSTAIADQERDTKAIRSARAKIEELMASARVPENAEFSTPERPGPALSFVGLG